MKYILDSNTLIRAANEFYRFAVVPTFWKWLAKANQDKIVFSIDAIKREVIQADDQLRNWLIMQKEFFLPTDTVGDSFNVVSNWAYTHPRYTAGAKNDFLACADYSLVAYGHAHSCTVVTFEKDDPNKLGEIKLPCACKALGVECKNLYDLLSDLKVVL